MENVREDERRAVIDERRKIIQNYFTRVINVHNEIMVGLTKNIPQLDKSPQVSIFY